MLRITQDLIMPTAITGSYPRPLWFTESLHGRSFKAALGDSIFRERIWTRLPASLMPKRRQASTS